MNTFEKIRNIIPRKERGSKTHSAIMDDLMLFRAHGEHRAIMEQLLNSIDRLDNQEFLFGVLFDIALNATELIFEFAKKIIGKKDAAKIFIAAAKTVKGAPVAIRNYDLYKKEPFAEFVVKNGVCHGI